ncbi:unnamed protein product [Symbiodinium sp. KB8]|nr:unnamed protein product [Symbiodinium sp. KB8]
MESHRKAAIKKWMTLISAAGNAWEVARMSLLSDRPSDITGGLLQSVIDSLAGKATATLHARAGPLIRLVKFWADRGEICFPVREVQVYVFLKEVQDPAPTFPNSLLSSLRFARFTLGLIFVDGALESGRVRGVATQHYARKRRDVRRPALTISQVKRLEDIVLDRGRGGHDRMAAGFFLFLVYGRLRYSDGQRITSIQLDVDDLADSSDGFLECTAERTKTQVGDAKKRKALPVVVPVASVGRVWIFEWFQVRKQMGLAVSGQNLSEPFLPAPASGGRWTRTPLPVSSGADWLRSLLLGLETKGDIRVGTHSCKATALSWCAKYGLGHGPRKLLGYHIPRADRSMVVYSREELSSPVRSLVKVIREISSGNFEPDLTKSGLLARERRGFGGDELSESEGSSSSTEGSSDDEDVKPSEDEAAVEQVVGDWADHLNIVEGAVYARHKISRCIHVLRDEELRAAEIGLSNDDVKKLEEAGIVSMALFAFSCNYAPGGSDDKPFMEMIGRVLGDASDDAPIKKLAAADRAQRLSEQQARLSGLRLRGNLEPGDGLVDKAVSVYESDRLQYIPWAECTSREHELSTGQKKDQSLTFDSSGVLKLQSKSASSPCDTSTEMLVRFCLMRRGLALEQGNVISYANHDLLVEKLFEYRMMEAPPGFQKVSMKQLELADKRFWLLLAEHTRAGIKTTASGRPCDVNFTKCLDSTEFLSLLQHRPGAGGSSQQNSDGDEPPPKRTRWGTKGRGKGKNKSKGSASAQVPAALLALGCVAATPKGFLCALTTVLTSVRGPRLDEVCDPAMAEQQADDVARQGCAVARDEDAARAAFFNHDGAPSGGPSDRECLALEPAESFAQTLLLQDQTVTARSVLEVFELLPDQELPRGSALEGAKAFSIGAYSHGGIVGVRESTKLFPHVARFFCKAISVVSPSHLFSTITLHRQVHVSCHQDSQNYGVPNLVVPLTFFEGGQIFVHDVKGPDWQCGAPGHLLDVQLRPWVFNAKRYKHEVLPHSGVRATMVAYSVGRLHLLCDQ